jgi:hypothetical protein
MELHALLRVSVIAALSAASAPGLAASNASTVEEQIQALRQLVERQQAQLDEQQRQLAAQRVELDQLRTTRSEVTAPPPADTDTRLDAVERSLEQSKVVAQDNPTVRMNANRASITRSDGRSSLAVRANVQLDHAHHDQDPAGPLESDFRRGSVGSGSRENDAAALQQYRSQLRRRLAGDRSTAGQRSGRRAGDLRGRYQLYLNSNLKLMLNYLHIDVDRLNPAGLENAAPFGPPPATPPIGVNVGQTLDVYALRSQFSF